MPKNDELFLNERSALFLRRYLWLLISLLTLLVAQSLWLAPQDFRQVADKLAMLVLAGISMVLLRYRGIAPALAWLLWTTWLVIGVQIATRFGLRNAAILAYPLFVVMAAWILGHRHAIAMAAATVLLTASIAAAESLGYAVPAGQSHPMVILGCLVVVLAIGTFLSINFANNIREHYDRAQELTHTLEERVAERTAHLARANADLENTLATLQRTQHELVQAEKLASLGSLVAGVAHELNTPIGNAQMAASTLHDAAHRFADQAQSKTMQRSALNMFVQSATELSDLVLRSTHRASHLISAFKQVAVDRTSEQRRHFALAPMVQDVLDTLGPTLQRTPWALKIDIPEHLQLDSYPGALEQVVTNLVLNAAKHAFGNRAQGQITLRATAVARPCGTDASAQPWVQLQVQDDGNGIAPDLLHRVFEPFFTTKMGQGGSGLGLSICHNLALTVLGGSLTVASPPGQGCTFTLEIPCAAPSAEHATV